MGYAPRLTTQRLVLRHLARDDLRFYCELVAHPDVRRYLGGPVQCSAAVSRFRHSVGAQGRWVACLRDIGQPVGLVELGPHKDGQDIELSYQFHPRAWGQGLAREATARVVSHAFNDMQVPRLVAETQAANARSCTLLRRLGFTEHMRLMRFGAEQVIFSTSVSQQGVVLSK